METQNTLIGEKAGYSATKLTNSTLIGINAGADIVEGDGIVIIGDNIKNLDKSQFNVLFIGDKIAIGKTIFGEPINLKDVFIKFIRDYNDGIGTQTISENVFVSKKSCPYLSGIDGIGYGYPTLINTAGTASEKLQDLSHINCTCGAEKCISKNSQNTGGQGFY